LLLLQRVPHVAVAIWYAAEFSVCNKPPHPWPFICFTTRIYIPFSKRVSLVPCCYEQPTVISLRNEPAFPKHPPCARNGRCILLEAFLLRLVSSVVFEKITALRLCAFCLPLEGSDSIHEKKTWVKRSPRDIHSVWHSDFISTSFAFSVRNYVLSRMAIRHFLLGRPNRLRYSALTCYNFGSHPIRSDLMHFARFIFSLLKCRADG
jgi:hypothetical protein